MNQQREELLNLMVELDRESGTGNEEKSKRRIVNQLKSIETSKNLGDLLAHSLLIEFRIIIKAFKLFSLLRPSNKKLDSLLQEIFKCCDQRCETSQRNRNLLKPLRCLFLNPCVQYQLK